MRVYPGLRFQGKKKGLLYEGHFAYQSCPNVTLNWMNVVRDPIDRMISMFYFLRLKQRWGLAEETPKEVDRPPKVLDMGALSCFFCKGALFRGKGGLPVLE